MTEQAFINKNSVTWAELEKMQKLVDDKGLKTLPSTDIKRFLHLFRLCSHHLAYARTHFAKTAVECYLNTITARSHSYVYAVRKFSPGEILRYISYGFPDALKSFKWFAVAAFLVFLAGFLTSLVMVFVNDQNASYFVPQQYIDSIKQGAKGGGDWNHPLMSSYIMFNNISVALRAFVFGITLGIGTIYVLFYNGAMLGALAALVYRFGDSVGFWSLILPHGIIELMAIFISGAAGLLLAKALLIPGRYSRRDALVKAARNAMGLLGGVVIMLVAAGVIEGFFTPLSISPYLKLGFAAITFVLMSLYIAVPYLVQQRK